MDEWTIISLAVKCLPAALVVLILLVLLVEEYLRLMELAGLARVRSRAQRERPTDERTGGADASENPVRPH